MLSMMRQELTRTSRAYKRVGRKSNRLSNSPGTCLRRTNETHHGRAADQIATYRESFHRRPAPCRRTLHFCELISEGRGAENPWCSDFVRAHTFDALTSCISLRRAPLCVQCVSKTTVCLFVIIRAAQPRSVQSWPAADCRQAQSTSDLWWVGPNADAALFAIVCNRVALALQTSMYDRSVGRQSRRMVRDRNRHGHQSAQDYRGVLRELRRTAKPELTT